ncbi:MAG: hypothetical protein JHD39_01835 [Synechococcus sp. SupBloom_Metag_053]|nr:hypothetical protein [Synechococcus sp. SupBloom_Metag_053]
MVESLFPTPLWRFQYQHPQQENPQGRAVTNQGGWHSQTDLLDDQALAPLFRWIAASCQQAFTEIG